MFSVLKLVTLTLIFHGVLSAAYVVPTPKVDVLKPKGFRVSIPGIYC